MCGIDIVIAFYIYLNDNIIVDFIDSESLLISNFRVDWIQ
jgi:hypothetical protein